MLNLPKLSEWRSRKTESRRPYLLAGVATGLVATAGAAAWAYRAFTETAKKAATKVARRRRKPASSTPP